MKSRNNKAWAEMMRAWEIATRAVERAERKKRTVVTVYKSRKMPSGFFLKVHSRTPDNTNASRHKMRGMSARDWAANIMYAVEHEGYFKHASRDDLDEFLDVKMEEEAWQ